MDISLVVIPGAGHKTISLQPGTTLAALVTDKNLQDRNIIVNGTGVKKEAYATTQLRAGDEVFATGAVKGA